jgi:hypothetical protein
MSMIGLAYMPGIDVLPMWCTATTISPSAPATAADAFSYSAAHAGS